MGAIWVTIMSTSNPLYQAAHNHNWHGAWSISAPRWAVVCSEIQVLSDDPLLQRHMANCSRVVLRGRVGAGARRRGVGRERQHLDERSGARRRQLHPHWEQQQHPGLLGDAWNA